MNRRRFRRVVAFGVAVIVVIWFAFWAAVGLGWAAPKHVPQTGRCHPHAEVIAVLRDLGETVVGFGRTQGGGLLSVHSRPDGSCWSAVLTYPDGRSCYAAFGEGWDALPPGQDA